MIQKFVTAFEANKPELRARFAARHPESYEEIVKAVVEAVSDPNEYDDPDPDRIHEINDGDYQGCLVYVVGAKGYQPSDYWCVRVFYGSCSGCDTLEGIRHYASYDQTPTDEQVNDYMTLALHVVQGLVKITGESA